jgi:hypothetical protein
VEGSRLEGGRDGKAGGGAGLKVGLVQEEHIGIVACTRMQEGCTRQGDGGESSGGIPWCVMRYDWWGMTGKGVQEMGKMMCCLDASVKAGHGSSFSSAGVLLEQQGWGYHCV